MKVLYIIQDVTKHVTYFVFQIENKPTKQFSAEERAREIVSCVIYIVSYQYKVLRCFSRTNKSQGKTTYKILLLYPQKFFGLVMVAIYLRDTIFSTLTSLEFKKIRYMLYTIVLLKT